MNTLLSPRTVIRYKSAISIIIRSCKGFTFWREDKGIMSQADELHRFQINYKFQYN